MSVEFLRDLAQAHKGWEEEKGLLAAADEIERLRHALNVTDGQSRECLGDDDGVPCVRITMATGNAAKKKTMLCVPVCSRQNSASRSSSTCCGVKHSR